MASAPPDNDIRFTVRRMNNGMWGVWDRQTACYTQWSLGVFDAYNYFESASEQARTYEQQRKLRHVHSGWVAQHPDPTTTTRMKV